MTLEYNLYISSLDHHGHPTGLHPWLTMDVHRLWAQTCQRQGVTDTLFSVTTIKENRHRTAYNFGTTSPNYTKLPYITKLHIIYRIRKVEMSLTPYSTRYSPFSVAISDHHTPPRGTIPVDTGKHITVSSQLGIYLMAIATCVSEREAWCNSAKPVAVRTDSTPVRKS